VCGSPHVLQNPGPNLNGPALIAVQVRRGEPAAARCLWDTFAKAIDAVPDASVPVGETALVDISALVPASLAAAIPGR
jgi:hypothetical protein